MSDSDNEQQQVNIEDSLSDEWGDPEDWVSVPSDSDEDPLGKFICYGNKNPFGKRPSAFSSFSSHLPSLSSASVDSDTSEDDDIAGLNPEKRQRSLSSGIISDEPADKYLPKSDWDRVGLHTILEDDNAPILEKLQSTHMWLGNYWPADIADDDGTTPLMIAAERGYVAVMKLLLAAGANPHAVDAAKNTVMHEALYGGYVASVTLLLSCGVDLLTKNNEGYNCFELAAERLEHARECGIRVEARETVAQLLLGHAQAEWGIFHHGDEKADNSGIIEILSDHEDDDADLAAALELSLQNAEQQADIGPLTLPNGTTVNVPRDGNCFFYTLVHQSARPEVLAAMEGLALDAWALRVETQGSLAEDRKWVGQEDFQHFVERFPQCMLAVIDTRNPARGFTTYYMSDHGFITNIGNLTQPIMTTVYIAYTGNHFLSVTSCEALSEGAITEAFDHRAVLVMPSLASCSSRSPNLFSQAHSSDSGSQYKTDDSQLGFILPPSPSTP